MAKVYRDPLQKNVNSWWSLATWEGDQPNAYLYSSISEVGPWELSTFSRLGPKFFAKNRYTLENSHFEPKVMEVWKIIFHLNWVTFSNFRGCTLRRRNRRLEHPSTTWGCYLPEESFGYVWRVYSPMKINIDDQNGHVWKEIPDAFYKPSFLVFMLDFQGMFIYNYIYYICIYIISQYTYIHKPLIDPS